MMDEQDEDAMFERVANALRSLRQDAELVRSSGADGIAAALARAEAELRGLTTGIEALHQRVAQQQAVTVRLEAAATQSDAELQGVRRVVEALSRQVQEQAGLLEELSAGEPRSRPTARLGRALVVLVLLLGGGAAAWVASGRQPTLTALAHLSAMRLSKLSGIDLAGTGDPTRHVAADAPAPGSSPPRQPAAPADPVAREPADPPPQVVAGATGTPAVAPALPVAASGAAPSPAAPMAAPVAVPAAAPVAVPATASPAAAPMVAAVPTPPLPTQAAVAPPAEAAPAATIAEAAKPPAVPPESPVPAATEPAQPAPSPPVVPHQLVLRATANAWVEVRQKDGHVLLNRTLKAGETWEVPAEQDLVLDTGNAEGLDVMVDGVPTKLTGAKGRVIHNMLLDADLARLPVAAQGVR
jgi:hypothetical protein